MQRGVCFAECRAMTGTAAAAASLAASRQRLDAVLQPPHAGCQLAGLSGPGPSPDGSGAVRQRLGAVLQREGCHDLHEVPSWSSCQTAGASGSCMDLGAAQPPLPAAGVLGGRGATLTSNICL